LSYFGAKTQLDEEQVKLKEYVIFVHSFIQ